MKKLNDIELKNISGGKISVSYFNYLARGASLLLDLGRSLGTAIRRIGSNRLCSF